MIMAEGPKVRLVHCPKCGNLLPELPDYSVYQCGGCGTLLRAKKKVIGGDELLEKAGKQRDGEGIEKLEYLSEKESVGLANESEVERECDGFVNARRKERLIRESLVDLVKSSSSRAETREPLVGNVRRIVVEQKMGYQSGSEHIDRKIAKYRQPLKPLTDGHVEPEVGNMNMNVQESSINSNRGKSCREDSSQFKDSVGSLRSRAPWRWDFNETGRGGSNGDGRTAHDSRKFPMSAYSDEVPLNISLASTSYENGKSVRNYEDPDVSEEYAYSDHDRAELLQKLDELKEQLRRHGSVAEKQRFQDPVDSRSGPPVNHRRYPTYSSSIRPLVPDKHVDAPYFKPYDQRRVPHENIHDAGIQNLHLPSYIPGHENFYQQPISGRHPYLQRSHNGQQLPGGYFPGQHINFNQYPSPYYHPEALFHQPACSCFQCRNKKWPNPSRVAPSVFDSRKFPNESADSNFKREVNPVTFRPPYYPQDNTTMRSRRKELNAVHPRDIDEDMDGFCRRVPRKQALPHRNVQLCNPIAGGAPFITCYHCYESLTLPKKFEGRKKFQQKLRCGACSKVVLLNIENKRLVVSVYVKKLPLSNEVSSNSSDTSKQVLLSSDGLLNDGGTNCSYNFDSQSYEFCSADFKELTLQKDSRLNAAEFEKRQQLTSSFSASPVEEEKLEKLTGHSSEPPLKDVRSPTLKDVPIDECLNDVSSSNAIDRNEKESRSSRMDQEKLKLDTITSRQNSAKDVQETEVEVSFNDYLNGSFSQDFAEVSEAQSRTKKGTESFLVGFIKKSLREFSRSNQSLENEKPRVFVNGQPISESMLKKAEKVAGPIHPGDYWYDHRGGFWGVMGHQCFGIIPPSIEEFNHPMPKNCAAGNTNIFVNGRELHQKDLELLSGRGLPTNSGMYYTIDITGKVIDEGTGDELNRLGRLAPTVEKMKRGFGMKVPRFLL